MAMPSGWGQIQLDAINVDTTLELHIYTYIYIYVCVFIQSFIITLQSQAFQLRSTGTLLALKPHSSFKISRDYVTDI